MPRGKSLKNLSISQLREVLASREGELNKLHSKREAVLKQLSGIDAQISVLSGSEVHSAVSAVKPKKGRRGGRRAQNAVSLVDTMHEVLSKADGPVKVVDIAAAVVKNGYKTNSKNFRVIVNQMLIKDKRFVSAGRGLYKLR